MTPLPVLVKTIEEAEEFIVNFGMKRGQTKQFPQKEETADGTAGEERKKPMPSQ